MTHYDEDKLTEFALELLDTPDESREIEEHLAGCAECRARLESIRHDLDSLGSVGVQSAPIPLPRSERKRPLMVSILRIAAVLVFGMVIGYGAARWQNVEPVCVGPAYLKYSPPAAATGLAVSDATGFSYAFDRLNLSPSQGR